MNRPCIHRALAVAATAVLLCLPTAAQACTVCMGDVNSKTAGAINAAMFLMIGFVGLMMASLGGFAFYLSRRAAASVPPFTGLDSSSHDPENLS